MLNRCGIGKQILPVATIIETVFNSSIISSLGSSSRKFKFIRLIMSRTGILLLACVVVAVAVLLKDVSADDAGCRGDGSRFRKCKMSNGKDGKCNSGGTCRPLNSCEAKKLDCPRATSVCRKGKCVTGKPNNTCESDGWECQDGFRCSGGVCFPRN